MVTVEIECEVIEIGFGQQVVEIHSPIITNPELRDWVRRQALAIYDNRPKDKTDG